MLEDEMHIARLKHSLEVQIELNAELVAENEKLRNKPAGLTFEQQYLIDLCGRMAEAWRYKFDVLLPGIQEIIKAWDRTNKGQEKEGRQWLNIEPPNSESQLSG